MDRGRLALAGFLSMFTLLGPGRGGAQETPPCADAKPPTGTLRIAGPQVRVGEQLYTSTAARVEVAALDAAGRPAQWKPVVEGREEAVWPATWSVGGHAVGAVLLDGCGNSGAIAPVPFVVDAKPPAIHWQVGDRQTFSDRLAPDSEPQRRHRRGTRGEGRPAEGSWESNAGIWQVPVPWLPGRGNRAASQVVIASTLPQAFLDAPATVAAVDGSSDSLGDHLLWIAADDDGAGIDRMTLRLRAEGDHSVLEVEAVDLVGNSSRKEIVLRQKR
jgi:hypothetical protein